MVLVDFCEFGFVLSGGPDVVMPGVEWDGDLVCRWEVVWFGFVTD